MENISTYENLVRFIYRDMSAEEAMNFADFVDADFDARLAFDELLLAKLQLPKVQFDPSPNTLNNILQYSKSTALEASL